MAQDIKLLVLDVDGTLTDGSIYINESGEQTKRFNVKDGMGIVLAQEAGFQVGIISHSSTGGMIEARANTLKIQHLYIGKRPKLEVLNEWLTKLQISLDQVAYIGDDVNDIDIIQAAGLTACPSDAIQQVKESVDIVLKQVGGRGAVREFIDDYMLSKTSI